MPVAPPLAPQELPLELQPSPCSYATAVALSAVFGFVGVQHFYLKRWAEGLLDLALTAAWITCFVQGRWAWGGFFMLLDFGHSLVVTILLMTGNWKDGEGRVICYPGQKLRARRRG